MGIEAYVAMTPDLDLRSSVVLLAPYDDPVRHCLTRDHFPTIRDLVSFRVLPVHPRMHDHLLGAVLATVGNRGSQLKHLDLLAPRDPVNALPQMCRYILGRSLANVRWIVIDEGIGSYSYQAFPGREERQGSTSGLRPWLLRLFRRRTEPWVRAQRLETRYVFQIGRAGHLVPDPVLAPLYLGQLRSQGDPLPPGSRGRRVLLVTDPGAAGPGFHYYDRADERRLMVAIIQDLLDKGYCILVKPHPCEPPDWYNYLEDEHVSFADSQVSAERLAAKLSPADIVVGISSSALHSIHLLTGVRTYSAVDLAASLVTPLAPTYPQLLQEFRSIVLPALSGTFEQVPACAGPATNGLR